MTKQVVVLYANGHETILPKPPTWEEMKAIIKDYIQPITVLDRIKPNGKGIYTFMFVDEEGLIKKLPRNEKATEIYQRNIRAKFPNEKYPFKAAMEEHRNQAKTAGFVVIDENISNIYPNYDNDPWIAGDVIFFEGYTVKEVDKLVD